MNCRKDICLTLLVLFSIVTALKAQNEVVTSKSGEKITGEIKGLAKNVLTIETDYSDSDFKIDWEEVAQIQSNEVFRIILTNGVLVEGTINSESNGTVAIVGSSNTTLDLLDIVELVPVDKGFWNRLTLGLSAGYSFTKASSTQQINVRTYAGYRTDHWDLDGDFSSNDTRIDTTATRRVDAGVGYKYFIGKRWYAMFNVDWLSNTEQELDLRTTTYLGIGNFLIRDHRMILSAATGVTYNNERFLQETVPVTNSSEVFVSLDYQAFNIGDLSLFTKVVALPSITEQNRVRTNFKTDIKWDLPKDFFFNLGFTLNYDSRPPNDASTTDYIFTTSVGWDL